MHCWGDEWFEKHGPDLWKAINYCINFWRRWGRIGSHGKEKYGTFRHHAQLWDGGLHTLIWPGYVRIVNGFIYWYLDQYLVKPFTKYTGLHRLGLQWQRFIYNYAIQKMCKQYPDIVDELVMDADWPEYIKGAVDGKTIHDRYWTTVYSSDKGTA